MQRINELNGRLEELSEQIRRAEKNMVDHENVMFLKKEYEDISKELREALITKFSDVELWGYLKEDFESDLESDLSIVVEQFNSYIIIDRDLDFLNQCTDEQLKLLCDILTKDEKGEYRVTELMSVNDLYIENYPHNMKKLIPLIKKEFYDYGGGSFKNFFRRIGLAENNIKYRDILEAVCDRAEVNYNKGNSTALVERYLIQKVCITSIDNMAEEDIFHIAEIVNEKTVMKAIESIAVSGPAYRVIVPAVLAIVYLRYNTDKGRKNIFEFFA